MKRKAMLMGMAFVTSLPGWALAKGSTADPVQGFSIGSEAQPLQQLEGELIPLAPDMAGLESPPRKASEVLSKLHSMLRGVNYGAVTQPSSQGWVMELLEGKVIRSESGDPRLQGAKPLGVAFRLRF